MLYCYHYDPSTGKYGAAVMNIMRVAGVVTLLVIGGMLLVLRKIGRRRQAATAEAISDLRSQI